LDLRNGGEHENIHRWPAAVADEMTFFRTDIEQFRAEITSWTKENKGDTVRKTRQQRGIWDVNSARDFEKMARCVKDQAS
jgi:hypothetical protein